MSIRMILAFLVCCLILCSSKSKELLNQDYAGFNKDRLTIVNYSGAIAVYGIAGYYSTYSEYPNSWNDVLNSNIVQVQLFAPCGEAIDLDDNSLDFAWDMYYIPQSGAKNPALVIQRFTENQLSDLHSIYVSLNESIIDKDFSQYFSMSEISFPHNVCITEPFEDIYVVAFPIQKNAIINVNNTEINISDQLQLKDKDTAQLIALSRIMNESVRIYQDIYGITPATWQELIASGIAPIDRSSINPITGGPIHFDGRKNDLSYVVVSLGNESQVKPGREASGHAVVYAIDETGNEIHTLITD